MLSGILNKNIGFILQTIQIAVVIIATYLSMQKITYKRNVKRQLFLKKLREESKQINGIMESIDDIERNPLYYILPLLILSLLSYFTGSNPLMEKEVILGELGSFYEIWGTLLMFLILFSVFFSIISFLMLNFLKGIDWKEYLPYKNVKGVEIFCVIILVVWLINYVLLFYNIYFLNLAFPRVDVLYVIQDIIISISLFTLHTLFWRVYAKNKSIEGFKNGLRQSESLPEVVISSPNSQIKGKILDFLDNTSLKIKEFNNGENHVTVIIPWSDIIWIKLIKEN